MPVGERENHDEKREIVAHGPMPTRKMKERSIAFQTTKHPNHSEAPKGGIHGKPLTDRQKGSSCLTDKS